MPGRMSLPVEDPDEPDRPKGFRSVEEDTLGPGNHLNREGKKMVLLVYEAFRDDLIRVNTKLVKKKIGESRDKTAWLLDISRGPVRSVISESNLTGGFVPPAQRGGCSYERSGCASHEACAAIHASVYSLQHKNPPVPTSVPKILKEIAAEQYKDDEGQLLKLTAKMVNRLLHLCGYVFGRAKEHHIAKLTTGNIKYRKSYCQRVLECRDGLFTPKGLPTCPEYFQDESYCNVHHVAHKRECLFGRSHTVATQLIARARRRTRRVVPAGTDSARPLRRRATR